jgi:hypothetical protein
MASYTISPIWGAGAQLFDNNGVPLSGGKVYVYFAGSTTPATTYTGPLGTVANTNPIIADAAGRLPNEIWFAVSQSFKFVLKDTNDVLLATYDNVPSSPQPPIVNDASSISYTTPYLASAGVFTVGETYQINFLGTTDFTAIGAAANVVGLNFVASGPGTGTGTAYYIRTVQDRLRDYVSVKDFGAVGNGVADDTAAFAAAIAASKHIYIPEGTYLVDTVAVTGNGYSVVGASPVTTVIKARTSATTKLFDVHGVSGYARENTFRNFTLDMTNMNNAGTSYGLYLNYAFNLSFEQIKVIGDSTAKIALFAESTGLVRGVYTSVFSNCDFSSLTGKIKLAGVSLSDAITTFTFVGCAFGACIADNVVSISFVQPIAQGALDKFTLNNVAGFTIVGGDIEGSGTAYVFGTNVNHFASINNEFSGFSGTYKSGTFDGGYLLDSYGSEPFSFYPVNNQATIHNAAINELTSAATNLRKLIRNTNATSYSVDTQYQNANGSSFVGTDATGNTYIDARGTGKVTLQQAGADRLGVTAANLMLVGTLTSGSAGSLVGYLRFVNGSGTEYKIPYYSV